MRISHLRYLLEIDKHHSISAAAQDLYLGQTTLSAIVRGLEDELGFRLFNRTRSGVTATSEGEEALILAWDICNCFDAIKKLGEESNSLQQPVSIATSPTVNSALALPLNKMFNELEPTGNLEFQVMSGEKVGASLVKNDYNIGVTYMSVRELENYQKIASRYQIQVSTLMYDSLYLLVNRSTPLARRDSVFADELSNMTFAMLPHFNSAEGSIAYAKNFGTHNHYTTFSTVALVKQAVLEQNMVSVLPGYAIVNNHSVDNRLLKPLQLLGTSDSNQIHLCLIHQSDSNLRYQEKLVLQCIREHFQELAPIPFAPKFGKFN